MHAHLDRKYKFFKEVKEHRAHGKGMKIKRKPNINIGTALIRLNLILLKSKTTTVVHFALMYIIDFILLFIVLCLLYFEHF